VSCAVLVVVSCAGAATDAAGAGVGADAVVSCAGAGWAGAGCAAAAGADVIAWGAGAALGSGALGTAVVDVTVSELDDDEVGAGSLATLRWRRSEAATLLFERDGSREGLAFGAGASTSFTDLLLSLTDLVDFAGGVVEEDDSAGSAGAAGTFACASVVEEGVVALVSEALGVVAAATGVARTGTVGTGWEATWRSNANAPTITTAVIVPNAIPKCLTRLLPKGCISLGIGNRARGCVGDGRIGACLQPQVRGSDALIIRNVLPNPPHAARREEQA
jgi:hypothetical protein